MILINFIKKGYTKEPIRFFEIIFLGLMLLSLPSIEAPKNIFLVLFLLTSLLRIYRSKINFEWEIWDWIFSSLIISAFLGHYLAYFKGNTFGAFTGMAAWILVGWATFKAEYSLKERVGFLLLAIIATLPPLILGLIQLLFLHTKSFLELHSVGHFNHSAIFLCIITGAIFGIKLALLKFKPNLIARFYLFCFMGIFFYISLIISSSRGALAIGSLIIACLILLSGISYKNKIKELALLTLMFSLVFIFNAPILQKHVADIKNNEVTAGRDKLFNLSLEASKINPIFGIGNANYKYIDEKIIKDSVEKRGEIYISSNYLFNAKHAHNLYLNNLVERGAIGLIIITIFLFYWSYTLKKYWRISKTSYEHSILWAGSFSAFLSTSLIGILNSTLHHEHGILSYTLLGLHLGAIKLAKKM
jgi:O-antigen ligase